MKRLAVLAVIILGLGAAGWGALQWFANKQEYIPAHSDKEIQTGYAQMGRAPLEPSKPLVTKPGQVIRLAIGNLGLLGDQGQAVSDILLARLGDQSGLELVDRQSLDKVLNELKLSLSGLVRAQDALRVGKLVRAEWFLLGTPLNSKGTNYIVVRMVDAATGMFRNSTSIQATASSAQVAENLAQFIRRCRAQADSGRSPTYLAFGAFQDLSLNNRQAQFPTQLRSYLTAAYKEANVTLLERDHMDALLQEIQLDLVGLTQNMGVSPAPMQSAVWLVEGDYQEQGSAEVELALKANRVFGRYTVTNLQGVPDERLFAKVKLALDHIINKNQDSLYPTLASEVKLQMQRGMELAELRPGVMGAYENSKRLTPQETEIQRRKVEEAIRAFKAVLLLEHTNRAAKVFLGACYCKTGINRTDDGRSLFLEVMEEPVQDQWHDVARVRLKNTFMWVSGSDRARWYSQAKAQAVRTQTRSFLEQEVEKAEETAKLEQGVATQPEEVAEKKLRDDIRAAEAFLDDKGGRLESDLGFYDYYRFFAPDRKKPAQNVAILLPHLLTECPKIAPHVAAYALAYQRDTNGPAVSEFLRCLEFARTHPKLMAGQPYFWSTAAAEAYNWCIQFRRSDVAVRIMEAMRETAASDKDIRFKEEDYVALAFAHKAAGQWDKALAAFMAITNSVAVEMGRQGPWGKAFTVVPVAKQADLCRERLGQMPAADPREFSIGQGCLCMHTPSAFTVTKAGLWVAIGSELLHLSFDLRTNKSVSLPKEHSTGVNAVLASGSKIWVATDGAGLIEYDELTDTAIRYDEKRGLKKDVVSTLCLAGGVLWIGYGTKDKPTGFDIARQPGGGLGLFELQKKEFRSFTPALADGSAALKSPLAPEPSNIPVHSAVHAIASGSDGDIWFLARSSPLRRFRPQKNTWEGVPEITDCSALLSDTSKLFVARFGAHDLKNGPLGVSIFNYQAQAWTHLGDLGVLPSGTVSALALDGQHLWVGCTGFIAAIDLENQKLLHYAAIPARAINSIQLGGGYLWAQFNDHLYRTKVP